MCTAPGRHAISRQPHRCLQRASGRGGIGASASTDGKACDVLAYLSINHRAVGRRIGWPEPEQQTRTSPRLPAPAPASAPLPSSTSHSPRHARRPTSQVSRRASLISRSRLPTSTADGFLASNARSSAIDNLALAHLTARRPQLPVAARPLLLPASHPNAPSPKL